MKKIFDLDKLVSIEVFGKEETWNRYYFHKERTNWYGKKYKEGFYHYGEFKGTKEEILENKKLMIEDNIIYYKPKVILMFVDGSKTSKYFDTFSQASKYGYDIASKNITSKLEIKD